MANFTPIQEFERWLTRPEGEHLEFKEARNDYTFDKLARYCCALANERGGKVVLGVSDQMPRQILGTAAFNDTARTVNGLVERLRIRIECEELAYQGKRVLIFHVPSRALGMPISVEGAFWMRAGESLVGMTQDQLKRIFDETGPDFSSEICPSASFDDLDTGAIAEFRTRWLRRSGNRNLEQASAAELLADAELAYDGQVTYAALILFGTRAALGRHLGQSELVFEYRSSESSIPFQQRIEFRTGFFSYYDQLWEAINARNDRQSYQAGLFRFEVPTFSEGVVREAILNAVCHRDYRLSGSIFIKQYPRILEVISPGGFPPGITAQNILEQQNPRNRRLAEAFAKCGLIERSGQGMNRIFEDTIKDSKPLPDLSGSASHEVRLLLNGQVRNPAFVRFLNQVGEERLVSFTTSDLLILDAIQRDQAIPDSLRSRLARLVEMGVVESLGRGRGVRYLLARRFYVQTGLSGSYTRKRGLDHETNKELLLKHLRELMDDQGAPLSELCQVLPNLSQSTVQRLLNELREEGRVTLEGVRRWGRWHILDSKRQKTEANTV